MPIEYQGKKYSFQGLEKKIKKSKPGIKSPGGYVHSIEENQHKAAYDPKTCFFCKKKFDTIPERMEHQDSQHPKYAKKTQLIARIQLAGAGHDNATRGATDEEQKKIDEARKKKNKINARGTASSKHMSNGIEYAKSLKARLQKLASFPENIQCDECGKRFNTVEEEEKHYQKAHPEQDR